MRIVVVGGGVTGLAAAQRLRVRAGAAAEIVVLERGDRLGGKVATAAFAGRQVETGAETFLVREAGAESAVLALAREVGLADVLVHPAPVPAAIAVGGQLRPIPGGTLLGIPADPSTVSTEVSDVDSGEPLLAAGQDVGVGVLVRGRYGDRVVDELVDPMLGGVYAGRADELSLAVTVPGLHRAAQRERTLAAAVRAALAAAPRPAGAPVFASVHGGLSRLVDAVAASAVATVRLNTTVRELYVHDGRFQLVVGPAPEPRLVDADAVVLAVPAAPVTRLLTGGGWPGLDLAYASVALVSFAFPPGTELPHLSGFLVPATEGYAVKAATFFSTKWSHLGGSEAPVLVRASLGRHGEEAVLQHDDADLVARAHADLAALTGRVLPAPLATRVNRWGGGLPQYGVGHADRVAALRAALPARLAVAGAACDGVGIAACVRSGQAAADTVWSALGE